jgi:hypothetical protein
MQAAKIASARTKLRDVARRNNVREFYRAAEVASKDVSFNLR